MDADAQQILRTRLERIRSSFEVLEYQFLKETTFCTIPTTNSFIGTFLHRPRSVFFSGDLPSVADLLIASELDSLISLQDHPNDSIREIANFEGFPRIQNFLQELELFCDPVYKEVISILRKPRENKP